jgi:CRP-like cAMP-binding protein
MALARALATVPLFADLTPEQLAHVAGCLRRRPLAEDEVIVQRDGPGDALFILSSGKAKVSYTTEDGETIIAMLSPGDFFGELSLLDGGGRSADVVAVEPSEVLVLSADDVHLCLHAFPSISIALLKGLAGRLRRATDWIAVLSSQDVYGRIARQLLNLATVHGVPAPGGGELIRLRLTQIDLAGMVGASRESVNKAMRYFKSKEYITFDGTHHVTILNRAALEKRCQ